MASLVLIVDDFAVIRRMLREVFEAEDLEVLDAANGAEGVQKAQEAEPGLIVLDLSMPVMNGLDAARELKVLMPHVPLLMFTNNAGGIVEKEARSAGNDRFQTTNVRPRGKDGGYLRTAPSSGSTP